MKIPEQPTIDEALDESVSLLVSHPKLIFPSVKKDERGKYTSFDSCTCPIDKDILSQRGKNHYECNDFWERVKCCRALYILDLYFDAYAIECLHNAFTDSTRADESLKEIYLLYGGKCSTGERFKKIFEDLKKRCKKIKFRHNNTLNPMMSPHVHDRFALTDEELWHFGSTVGGAYQGHTALSRGWLGQDGDFIKFFNIAFYSSRQSNFGGNYAGR
jgi:hypothetical protein